MPNCDLVTVSGPTNQKFNNDLYSDGSIQVGSDYDADDHIGLAIGFDKDYPIDDFLMNVNYYCTLQYELLKDGTPESESYIELIESTTRYL